MGFGDVGEEALILTQVYAGGFLSKSFHLPSREDVTRLVELGLQKDASTPKLG
jgi:hypothetical protein